MSSLSFAFCSHLHHIVSPRFLSFALGNTGPRCSLLLSSSPTYYTGRQRNVPLPKRARGWDMMTPPPTSSTNAHLLCDCGTTRHTIHIHGRIGCKYAQYATTLLKTCRRGLALCTLVKHQHTLLSDISAVGSLDSLGIPTWCIVVIVYGVHTSHGASPLYVMV